MRLSTLPRRADRTAVSARATCALDVTLNGLLCCVPVLRRDQDGPQSAAPSGWNGARRRRHLDPAADGADAVDAPAASTKPTFCAVMLTWIRVLN
jgi:hypothetical protein